MTRVFNGPCQRAFFGKLDIASGAALPSRELEVAGSLNSSPDSIPHSFTPWAQLTRIGVAGWLPCLWSRQLRGCTSSPQFPLGSGRRCTPFKTLSEITSLYVLFSFPDQFPCSLNQFLLVMNHLLKNLYLGICF